MNAAMQAAIAQAAAAVNMNEAQAGGGGGMGAYVAPPGPCRLRFVSYIEYGIHMDKDMKGNDVKKDMVAMTFELSGKKYPPTDTETKRTEPYTITLNLNRSLNEKAWFYKLFVKMNYDKQATHMAELLGRRYLGTVVEVIKGDKTYANLKDNDGYTIKAPFMDFENEEGEIDQKAVVVAPATMAQRCWLWDFGDKEMWDGIFIDGKWDDRVDDKGVVTKVGISKNYWQNRIKAAINFPGSKASELCFGDIDVGEAEAAPRDDADIEASKEAKVIKGKGAAADPLAGM